MKDKNGVEIEIGMNVFVVGGLNGKNYYGVVNEIDEEKNLVIVTDDDIKFYETEPCNVEIQNIQE